MKTTISQSIHAGIVPTDAILTSFDMLTTNTKHPPACATMLIISLGLLSTSGKGIMTVIAAVVLLAVQ